LIPVPWVAPVWAPATVAALFIMCGSYLFWTAERPRSYRLTDIGVLIVAAAVIVASFVAGSTAVTEHHLPDRFPAWLFWIGVAIGSATFVGAEGRAASRTGTRRASAGLRVRTILPAEDAPKRDARSATLPPVVQAEPHDIDVEKLRAEYDEGTRRLDALVRRAHDLGDRCDHLAGGLYHPAQTIVGIPDRAVEGSIDWYVVPDEPLPSIEAVKTLLSEIRDASAVVEGLRQRLILSGCADVVEQPDGFFH